MVKKILEEKLISIPEVEEILDSVYEKMEKFEHLNPDAFQEATYDFVKNFAKLDAPSARKIVKMLREDYKMDETTAIQIVNINPQYPEELRVIFEKDVTLRDFDKDELSIIIQKVRDLQ